MSANDKIRRNDEVNYRLDCIDYNSKHTVFRVFDRGTVGTQSKEPTKANCGTLTIQTDDLVWFLQHAWKGDIWWNGLLPPNALDGQIANARNQGLAPQGEHHV